MDSEYPSYRELLNEIFANGDNLLPLRPKDISTINKVLEKKLEPREIEVIKMRFGLDENGKKYIYREIGERLNISPERVRQILAKAVRKLRHPANSREIRWLFRDKLEDDFAKTRDDLVEASKAVECLKDFEGVIKGLQVKSSPDVSIYHLDLSQRALNCLINTNIQTVRELSSWPESRLRGIRNLGERTLKEIKNKLAQFGLQLAEPL